MKNSGVLTLLSYTPPDREVRTLEDVVSMHLMENERLECDPFHYGGQLFPQLRLQKDERAIILSIKLKWCANNTGRDVHFEVHDLFRTRNNGRSEHPDNTGKVTLVIPARHCGAVPALSQNVYQPNLVNLGIPVIQYAGMEESILNARSTAILMEGQQHRNDEYEVFHQSDPLLVFLLRHMNAWPSVSAQDVLRLKDMSMYRVKRSAVNVARSVFEKAVFPLFCYTHKDNKPHLVWNKAMEPPPLLPDHLVNDSTLPPMQDTGFAMLTFRVEMEYVLVSHALRKDFTCKETPL